MSVGGRVKERISLAGWPRGLFQSTNVDSSRVDKATLHRAKNVVFDETGGVKMRGGITNRLPPLPSSNSRAFQYRKGSFLAILESDGINIRVLDGSGFAQIGSFTSGGTRADFQVVNGRGYFVNGSGKMMVVENFSGSTWDVREAGVEAPTNAPIATPSGGAGTTFDMRYAVTWVDDRGFESNVSPAVVVTSIFPGATMTVQRNNAAPSGSNSNWKWRVYSSLRNLNELFFVKEVPIASTSTTTDVNNLSRDEAQPAPIDHDVPPQGIVSLRYYRSRMYGAQFSGHETYYSFSELNSADDPGIEYWPPKNTDDLGVIEPSPTLNFIPVAGGLIIAKKRSILLLERDPEFGASPRPLIEQYGLEHIDGWMVVYGTALMSCEPGLVAHNGFRLDEVYRRLPDASGDLRLASLAKGLSSEREGRIFYSLPGLTNKVRAIGFEAARSLYMEAEYTVSSSTSLTVDGTLDFSQNSDVADHGNLASSATVLDGGIFGRWAKSVTHSFEPPVSPSQDVLNLDWVYSDAGGARTKIGSQFRTIDGTMPLVGSSLVAVRGEEVESGKLIRTSRLGPPTSTSLNDLILSYQPKVYYKLDESDPNATTAADSSGNGLNGSYVSLPQVVLEPIVTNSSAFARRYQQNVGRRIQNPNAAVVGFANGLTLSVFVSHDTIPTSGETHYVHCRTTSGGFIYRLRMNWGVSSRTLTFEFVDSSGVTWNAVGPATSLVTATGVTYHIWGSWYREGDTSIVAVGVDDTSITTNTYTIPSARTLSTFQFDRLFFPSGNDANNTSGIFDEISIYDKGLTLDQIIKLGRYGKEAVGSKFYATDGTTAYTAVTEVKSLAGFTSFDTTPIQITGTETPGLSKVRLALRFEDSSPPFMLSSWKIFQGGVWTPLLAEPTATNDNGTMTMGQVNALSNADLLSAGGLDTSNPKLQIRIWLSGDVATESSVDQITIRYFTQSGPISDAIRITENIPLPNGSMAQRGDYIWSSSAGYRLNDGTSDAGEPISCEIQTQQVAPVRGESDLITVEVDCQSASAFAPTVMVPTEMGFIVDGVSVGSSKDTSLGISPQRVTYPIGAPPDTFGNRHSVSLKWKEPNMKIHGMDLVVEPRGRAAPL